MKEANNTEDRFYQQLLLLYSIEDQLVEALPIMIEKANNIGLQKTLAHHLAETRQHKVAIGAICKQLGINPQGESDAKLKAILAEGEKAMVGFSPGDDLDAVIIEGAHKVEVYEIANYQSVAQNAEALGYEAFGKRLRLTLEEEQQSKTKLAFMTKALFGSRAEAGTERLPLAV